MGPDDLWLLQKTIYGPRRSPHHWFNHITGALKRLGLCPLPNEPCIYTGRLIPDEAPIYIGIYVDDFTYFSTSNATKRTFEERLGKEIEVEFMGPVTWFLGCLLCLGYISQTAKIESLLDQFNMGDCNPVHNVYRSGFPIDRIPKDDTNPSEKTELVKQYQSLVGGLNWLSLSSRPEITTVVRLLA